LKIDSCQIKSKSFNDKLWKHNMSISVTEC